MKLDQIAVAPVFPMGIILLLFLLGLFSSLVQYFIVRGRLGHVKAISLSALRLIGISLLISFALNPSIVMRSEHRVTPSLAVILDTSQSMGQSNYGGEGSRLDEARSLLLQGPSPLLRSLSENFEVRLYELGDSLRAVGEEELKGLKASTSKGDLTRSLDQLSGKTSLGLLLSDGTMGWDGSQRTDFPLITIPIGSLERYKDILIKEVKAPALAFRGKELTVDITLRSYGYSGLTVPVLLKDGNRLLTAKSTRIQNSPGETTVSLSFTPEEVGERNLSISVPQQFGEELGSNNTVSLPLKVVRDKIRVLMVSGNPSMNYRFMRTALKNDPSIDLLSFVILRTPSDIMNVPLQEQSLIPFPVDTLFSNELKNFDLLIFDNFRYTLFLNPLHLESIKEFVRSGGGFAFIGGPNLPEEGRYRATPIGEILPLRLTGKEGYRRSSSSGVNLSRSGLTHPITRLSSDEVDLSSFWREMPFLDGINLFEVKTSGSVLLESSDEIPYPILTVSGYGKGRVLVLATDYSWKWYMGMVAKGKGNYGYLRFIDRMVRWLTKDPSLEPVQVTLPEKAGLIGQEMEVRIKLREEDATGNRRSTVSLSVFSPDGSKMMTKLKSAQRPGEFLGSFVPEKAGMYKFRVETPAGHLEESIIITRSLERLDAAPDHEKLKEISASTGGKYLPRGENLLREIEEYMKRMETRFIEEKRFSVWTTPFVLALVLAFLGGEWYLRRRWGLI